MSIKKSVVGKSVRPVEENLDGKIGSEEAQEVHIAYTYMENIEILEV